MCPGYDRTVSRAGSNRADRAQRPAGASPVRKRARSSGAAHFPLSSIAVGWLLLPGAARAQATLRTDVSSGCPDAAQVTAALDAVGLGQTGGAEASAWTVRVQPATAGAARLTLVAPDASTSVEREILSDDCPALATAFALIVQTQFVKLHLLPPPPSETDPAAPPSAPPQPLSPPAPRVPARPPTPHLAFGASAGASLSADPSLTAAFGQIDATYRPRRGPLVARLLVSIESPTIQSNAPDRVERTAATTRIEAGLRLVSHRLWLQATAGAGLVVSSVAALDLTDRPSMLRAHPAFALSLAAGLRFAGSWSVRAEAAALGLPLADAYRIEPDGVVARSPRSSVLLGVGLEMDTNL